MRKLHTPQPFDVPRLLAAACVMMLSELCFTLYSEVTDAFNLLGHVYKVVAYGLLYKAMFVDSVKEPFQQLREAERNAWNDKERAEVTLASIGDAVITTDLNGCVENLNPVAEHLTGWNISDARGRNLEEIFCIVNESSGEPVDNPARRAIREGVIVGLANHTVLISRNGPRYAIEDSAAPIRDRQGVILGCVLVFHDVSQQRDLQNQMAWQAAHDSLTGLPNRVLLNDRLVQAIAHTQRQETLAVVCFLDLDYFKPVNDKYGHEMGDRVLIEMADRFRKVIRDGDTVARMGGDEFVILLTDIHNMDQVTPALQRILDVTAIPFTYDVTEIKLSASIGVSVYPFDEVDADTLLRHADQALYIVKERGRNGYHLFDAEQEKREQTYRSQVVRIRAALNNNELRLHYQPKVNMRTGEVTGLEALLRWQHPERGLVPPGEFLPLIEQSDLIIDVGEWVLNQAFQQMDTWLHQGIRLVVSVNIAARHLQLPDFVERMDGCLKNFPDLLPGQIELEVLESAALHDIENVRSIMLACLARGINFSLDDFGTGYSSLAYLKQLPAQTLKIDQTFVRDIMDDPDDLALTEAVIGLASVFERTVIAEGVETAAHGVLLMRLGCDLAQGYGISRALLPEKVLEWVRNYKQDPEWTLWSNIHWEMTDFPLLVAQHDHLKWIKQVIDSIDGIPLRVPAEQLLDSHQCRFGEWYYGTGATRYGHMAEFLELGEVHDEVHRIGPEIIRLQRDGTKEEARNLVPALLDLKDKILCCLALMQQQVAEAYRAEGGQVHEKN
jgi:diguanylate cyclase (GGDEF)-like protein/PAS domain S-box-containing protein